MPATKQRRGYKCLKPLNLCGAVRSLPDMVTDLSLGLVLTRVNSLDHLGTLMVAASDPSEKEILRIGISGSTEPFIPTTLTTNLTVSTLSPMPSTVQRREVRLLTLLLSMATSGLVLAPSGYGG